MKIPVELMEKWQALQSHGDGKKIAELNPSITSMDVSRAMNKGECADHIFQAIANFYIEKSKKLQEVIQQTGVEKETTGGIEEQHVR